jgi:dienelactone hydrolase
VLLVLVAAVAAALLASGPAGAFSKQDLTITSADGTPLAATLTLPDAPTPVGGWPALIFMHGLGQTRSTGLAVAQAMGIGERYAVLAYDARGHGQSGGLIGIDGPKEIADVRAVFAWLRDRPDVADTRIGGWGLSYGGGAAWNSLAAGVPWAALEVSISWTDLRDALLPQGLAKTGVIAGFIGSLDPKRIDPEVLAIRDAAYAGNIAPVLPFAAARSSLPALKGVKTPVFMMQGRRDFAFGMEHAMNAYRALAGPKELWFGLSGHAPSPASRPAAGDRRGPLVRPLPARRHRGARSPSQSPGAGRRPVRFAGCEGRDHPHGVRGQGDSDVREVQRTLRASPGRRKSRLARRQISANATGGWSRIVIARGRRRAKSSSWRRRPDPRREPHLPDRAGEPGDVRPEGLEADRDDRLVLPGPEPGQPALPRPPVPVDGAACRDGRLAEPPPARDAGLAMRRALAVVATVALGLVAAAGASTSAEPGVTPTSVLIGGTVPLSGEAAAFGTVAPGAKAYFDYVNSKGGVNGRKIEYRYYDDGYNPAQTVQLTRKLVEQDRVFAIFNAVGTANNLAIRDYLNAQKVPQLFAGDGSEALGGASAQYPWTVGFLPSYRGEGTVLGRDLVATRPKAKVAVLLENTELGKDMTRGLSRAISGKGPRIVASEPYELTSTDVVAQIAQLKAAGADTLMLFATPKFMIRRSSRRRSSRGSRSCISRRCRSSRRSWPSRGRTRPT